MKFFYKILKNQQSFAKNGGFSTKKHEKSSNRRYQH